MLTNSPTDGVRDRSHASHVHQINKYPTWIEQLMGIQKTTRFHDLTRIYIMKKEKVYKNLKSSISPLTQQRDNSFYRSRLSKDAWVLVCPIHSVVDSQGKNVSSIPLVCLAYHAFQCLHEELQEKRLESANLTSSSDKVLTLRHSPR